MLSLHFNILVLNMKYNLKQQTIAFIIIGIGLLSALNAQDIMRRPRRVEFSVMAGPTISWTSTPSEAFHNKGICVGGVYGVNADINIVPTNENYYFLVGINARHYFTKIQYTDKYDYYRNNKDTISNILSKYNDIYLSFPTAIKLKTNPFGRFTIFGVIGLEHGFCLSATSKDEVSPLKTEEEQIFKNVNRTQQTAVFKESLYVIFGFEFSIHDRTKATFGLAFDRGLNNLFKTTYKDNDGNRIDNNITISGEPLKAYYNNFEFQFSFVF